MKRNQVLFIVLAFIAAACSSSSTDEIVDGGNNNNPPSTECTPLYPDKDVTYNNYVKKVLDTHCVECHYAGNSPGPGNFTSYSGVLPYAEYFYARVIPDNADMPKGRSPLPKSTRDSLNIWLKNCAPQN